VIVYTINKFVKAFAVLFLLSLVGVHLSARIMCINKTCTGDNYSWIGYIMMAAGTIKENKFVLVDT
jgi:hypothetical protein